MANILENCEVAQGIYRMSVQGAQMGSAGQFYMLRVPGVLDPFLGRPISLHDYDERAGTISFLYQLVGKGTALLSNMHSGQAVDVQGPYGNGFSLAEGDVTLIGGGIGTAPMLLLAKSLRAGAAKHMRVHLGFREQAFLVEQFRAYADDVVCNIGGFVTQDVDFTRPGIYYACGPTPMMRAAAISARAANAMLYVSLEEHMACGVGACLGCTCKTSAGNKRICADGPVFLAGEVFHGAT